MLSICKSRKYKMFKLNKERRSDRKGLSLSLSEKILEIFELSIAKIPCRKAINLFF